MIPQRPGTMMAVLLGVMLATLVGNVALAVYAWLNRSRSGVDARDGHGASAPPVGRNATVQCPDCGADNDAGYRYCRNCVVELPGGAKFSSPGSSPLGRVIR